MKTGLILVAHGSRKDPAEGVELEAVTERIRSRADFDIVKYGCLRFKSPTLAQAAEEAIAEGASRLVIVPLFLFPGGHVLRDIPEELAALRQKHPEVEIYCSSHIGPDDRLVEIVLSRAREVIASVQA